MNAPAELADPKKLPDDLQLLLTKHKIPPDDPLIAVLEWHWLRTNATGDVIASNAVELETMLGQCREAIQEDRMKLQAALDERIKKFEEWSKTFAELNGHLEKLSDVLAEKPLGISQQIHSELAQPIAAGVASVKQIGVDVTGLLTGIDTIRKRLAWSYSVTTFLFGFAVGTLIISWIYSHTFLH